MRPQDAAVKVTSKSLTGSYLRLVGGGGFPPQSPIEFSEGIDSMMVGNAEKGQNGKFFIQFSFTFPFSLFPTTLLVVRLGRML